MATAAEKERKIHWWTRGTAIGTWIYTFVTLLIFGIGILSLYEARRATHAAVDATKITIDNFHIDERPYVFVEDDRRLGQPITFKEGERGRWDISYTNYGKTPGVIKHILSRIWIGKAAVFNM